MASEEKLNGPLSVLTGTWIVSVWLASVMAREEKRAVSVPLTGAAEAEDEMWEVATVT
jgi:hypothetical protein